MSSSSRNRRSVMTSSSQKKWTVPKLIESHGPPLVLFLAELTSTTLGESRFIAQSPDSAVALIKRRQLPEKFLDDS